jgi:hypothetical protein
MSDELSPYLSALEIIVLNATDTLTLDEVRAELKKRGWKGEDLTDERIRDGLSELAVELVREARRWNGEAVAGDVGVRSSS